MGRQVQNPAYYVQAWLGLWFARTKLKLELWTLNTETETLLRRDTGAPKSYRGLWCMRASLAKHWGVHWAVYHRPVLDVNQRSFETWRSFESFESFRASNAHRSLRAFKAIATIYTGGLRIVSIAPRRVLAGLFRVAGFANSRPGLGVPCR